MSSRSTCKKSVRLSDYHFPYVVLISKFLQYFEVDLEKEFSKVVNVRMYGLKREGG